MNALLYSNGVCLDFGKRPGIVKTPTAKRGKLDGKYSSASFRRLRQYCITHDCNGECWGITLTIPGLDLVPVSFVKQAVHTLCVWANDNHIPLIWRCELQQRGQPHLHIVAYCSAAKCIYMFAEWQKLVSGFDNVYSVEMIDKNKKDLVCINRMFVNGSNHAFDLQKLTGDFRSWRYLVAHTSKGKQAQMGWQGRQWGVINRAAMTVCDGFNYELEDCEIYAVRRWVRRLSRRRINHFGKHFLLLNPNTLMRMIEFVKDGYFDTPF